ncbi:phage holin family protein [Isosphaeraceae bacterium EP7]
MASQATMKNNGIATPLEGVVESVAGLGGDIASLAELQGKLALADLRESTSQATVPATLLATGVVVALSTVPVALVGLAYLVAESTGWRTSLAFLATAAAALAVALVVSYVGYLGLTKSFGSFRRSRDELTRNVSWIKTVLLHSGRSVAPRRIS